MNRQRKKRFILSAALLSLTLLLHAQEMDRNYKMPAFAIKTNALYLATATPNLGFEFALGKKHTMEISGNYNPFRFSDKKLKHWLIQPEYRYWFCDRFYRHFIGVHAHYAEFNVANIGLINTKHYRYQGHLYGGGISYGYHWILGNHWSLETTIGIGYARVEYDKYPCKSCSKKIKKDHKNYFGPTKAAVSLVYVFK